MLVVGASGLVGSNVVRRAPDRLNVTGTYYSTPSETASYRLDKTDEEAVRSLLRNYQPDAVIDTAAMTDVDDCESSREAAWEINAEGTRAVASAADAVDAHYVGLSTDYVFRGDPEVAPYVEDDPVGPDGYYARTKYAGEVAARLGDRWTILRPSVVYGTASDNFLTWAIDELDAGRTVSIVEDQVSSPTYAPDLADACLAVVESETTGLYHTAGPVHCSRYEFTRKLARVMDFDPALVDPISTEELGQEAPRPADASLDSSRFADDVGTVFRPPTEAFEDALQQ